MEQTLSRGIACSFCGLSVEHNGSKFLVIEDTQGFTLAYVCDEDCQEGWSKRED